MNIEIVGESCGVVVGADDVVPTRPLAAVFLEPVAGVTDGRPPGDAVLTEQVLHLEFLATRAALRTADIRGIVYPRHARAGSSGSISSSDARRRPCPSSTRSLSSPTSGRRAPVGRGVPRGFQVVSGTPQLPSWSGLLVRVLRVPRPASLS